MISVTVDTVVFSQNNQEITTHVLFVQRGFDPFKDCWALPGGFVNEGEALDDAAMRELKEETGLAVPKVWQVGTYGDPGRDPRGHVISVAHMATVKNTPRVNGRDDARDAAWVPLNDALRGEGLAFDHARIVERAYMVYSGNGDG